MDYWQILIMYNKQSKYYHYAIIMYRNLYFSIYDRIVMYIYFLLSIISIK